jgi:hypothetical protein
MGVAEPMRRNRIGSYRHAQHARMNTQEYSNVVR